MKSLSEFYDHDHPLLAWSESVLTDIEETIRIVHLMLVRDDGSLSLLSFYL